jgi:hypothetical protein
MFRKNYSKIKIMNTYKITHKERDHTLTWRKVYSIIKAETKEEAIIKLDRHKSLIKKIELLSTGEPNISTKQNLEDAASAWFDKIRNQQIDNRHAIYKIKSPSHKKTK